MHKRVCNRCLLNELEAQSEAMGRVCYVERSTGIIKAHVYDLPVNVDFKTLTHRQKRELHLASFMELPETCAC